MFWDCGAEVLEQGEGIALRVDVELVDWGCWEGGGGGRVCGRYFGGEDDGDLGGGGGGGAARAAIWRGRIGGHGWHVLVRVVRWL